MDIISEVTAGSSPIPALTAASLLREARIFLVAKLDVSLAAATRRLL